MLVCVCVCFCLFTACLFACLGFCLRFGLGSGFGLVSQFCLNIVFVLFVCQSVLVFGVRVFVFVCLCRATLSESRKAGRSACQVSWSGSMRDALKKTPSFGMFILNLFPYFDERLCLLVGPCFLCFLNLQMVPVP